MCSFSRFASQANTALHATELRSEGEAAWCLCSGVTAPAASRYCKIARPHLPCVVARLRDELHGSWASSNSQGSARSSLPTLRSAPPDFHDRKCWTIAPTAMKHPHWSGTSTCYGPPGRVCPNNEGMLDEVTRMGVASLCGGGCPHLSGERHVDKGASLQHGTGSGSSGKQKSTSLNRTPACWIWALEKVQHASAMAVCCFCTAAVDVVRRRHELCWGVGRSHSWSRPSDESPHPGGCIYWPPRRKGGRGSAAWPGSAITEDVMQLACTGQCTSSRQWLHPDRKVAWSRQTRCLRCAHRAGGCARGIAVELGITAGAPRHGPRITHSGGPMRWNLGSGIPVTQDTPATGHAALEALKSQPLSRNGYGHDVYY